MRPEDFSPGNHPSSLRTQKNEKRFNEAGGFLPRKPYVYPLTMENNINASMRPEDFSPGNINANRMRDKLNFYASMRPEDFSPGNLARPRRQRLRILVLQ